MYLLKRIFIKIYSISLDSSRNSQMGILFCRYYICTRAAFYIPICACMLCMSPILAVRARNISDRIHLQVTQRSSIFRRHGNVHTLHMSPRWHISNNASFYDNSRFISHDVSHYSYNLYFVYKDTNLNYERVISKLIWPV